MEYTNKTYILLKAAIYSMGFVGLIFISNFWIGTEENWNEMIRNELIPMLITRIIFSIIVGLFFLGLSFGISLFYKKKGAFSKEFIFLVVFSLAFNLIRMLAPIFKLG